MPPPKKLLLVSQVFVPDPTSVGQHFADVAQELASRGWLVTVITADRGYSDPCVRFPRSEFKEGVEIRRLPLSSFGKRSIAMRLAAQISFVVQSITLLLFLPKPTVVLVSTSPPFGGLVGVVYQCLKRVPFVWWVMDINPDQIVQVGALDSRSQPVRLFDHLNRTTLRLAKAVVTLDRFMVNRLEQKHRCLEKLDVVPPWPHTDVTFEGHYRPGAGKRGARFRADHNLQRKFIVMYSGNHAIQHPLTTLLDAAKRVSYIADICFVFVGGGSGKAAVEDRISSGGAHNILSLPYQPLSQLEECLSSADVHVVSMGDDVVGIVHPCKIYGAMAVGRPILFFGPRNSHAGELVEPNNIGWRVDHGDVEAAVQAILAAHSHNRDTLAAMGQRAARVVDRDFARRKLIAQMADIIEQAAQL